MRTMLLFSTTPLTEGDVDSHITQEPGGYWLPGERRGVIDTDDSTVYIDLADDITSEALGLDAGLEQQIVQRLGQPWKGVLLIHISHAYAGSTESAIRFLNAIRNTRGGVVFDGDCLVG